MDLNHVSDATGLITTLPIPRIPYSDKKMTLLAHILPRRRLAFRRVVLRAFGTLPRHVTHLFRAFVPHKWFRDLKPGTRGEHDSLLVSKGVASILL